MMRNFKSELAELENALAERGFEPIQMMGTISWQRKSQGRTCLISVSPRSRTRYYGEVRLRQWLGFVLNITLDTKVRTKLFFVSERFAKNPLIRWVYRLRKQEVLKDIPAELAGFHVVTSEVPYAERLLNQDLVVETVAGLLSQDASPNYNGSVYFMPTSKTGKLHYGSSILQAAQITIARTERTIAQLLNIAETAEKIEPPQLPFEANRFSRLTEKHPWIIAVVFFSFALISLGIAAVVAILVGYYIFA